MTDMVDYEVSGGVARLTMNNPPLNALGHGLRAALAEALERAEADESVKAIVLLAGGRSWPVGADIREFGQPPMLPHLPGLCSRFIAATKPVIAALHGSALGGGLELALVAAVRVADKATSLGLPEVTLGILPGAGGTQRLPRLIGAGPALQMMLSGAPVTAAAALAMGLIDKIAPGPVAEAAMAIAEAHVTGRVPLPVASRRKQPGVADAAAFLAEVAKVRAEARPAHDHARPRIIDCVEAALLLPPDEGLVFERAAFEDLVAMPEARALRYAFLAERRGAKSVPALAGKPKVPGKIGIVGAGAVGVALTGLLLEKGAAVTLVARAPEKAKAAAARIARALDGAEAKGIISADKRRADWQRLQCVASMDTLSGADLVIDCVREDLATKSQALEVLGALRPDLPILSLTCALDPTALAAATGRPDRHGSLWLSEPLSRVVMMELAADDSAMPAHEAAQGLAKLLGWRLLRQGPVAGFLGQRLWTTRRDVADRCLSIGAAPHEVDRALRSFGMPFGPFELADLYGAEHPLLGHPVRRAGVLRSDVGATVADWLAALGRTGRRGGRGYYLYADQGQPKADRELEAKLDTLRPRATVPPAMIERRLVAAMANDGAWALVEGRARQPSDIDLVAMAQGFPRWKGGPMQAADEAGLLLLRNDLVKWASYGDAFWAPAPIWDDLIREGRHFRDLNRD